MIKVNGKPLKEVEPSRKQQRNLNKEYRRAADAIINDQVKAAIKSLRERRETWKKAFIVSMVVNLLLLLLGMVVMSR